MNAHEVKGRQAELEEDNQLAYAGVVKKTFLKSQCNYVLHFGRANLSSESYIRKPEKQISTTALGSATNSPSHVATSLKDL